MAEYVTDAQLRKMNQKDMAIERDFMFGLDQQKTKEAVEDPTVHVEMRLLSASLSNTDT